MAFQGTITISTQGAGLYDVTEAVKQELPLGIEVGLLNVFIQHTSASLIIQENADPTARQDLEYFLNSLAPENQAWHKHTIEGPDDTTSHLKSALTQTSLSIPIKNSKLALGTWQGLYVWEHRKAAHQRNLLLTVID